MSIVVPDEKKDLLKRIDTSLLYPPFLEMVNTTLNGAAARGKFYIATNGTRSIEAQDVLFFKGRDEDGNIINPKLIVTNARGGYSAHNFDVAGDFYPDANLDKDGLQLPEKSKKEDWLVLAEEAVKAGLDAGYYWVMKGAGLKSDPPHLQLPIKKYGITWARLRLEYKTGGRPAVHKFLDRYQWMKRG